jgi:type II secretion system protein H
MPGIPNQGITLVEMLVVLVVVGLLAAIATPRFLTSMGESQLDADANRLMLDLQWAKTEAPKLSSGPTRTGTRLFVVLDTIHKSWTIYKDNGDSTFDTATDTMVKRDSLAGTSRFGFAPGFTVPSVVGLPLGAAVAVAPGGFGAVDPANKEDCLDGRIYPAPTKGVPTWAYTATGGGKIVVCGGTVGDMSGGALYITSTRSKSKAYAILFNPYTTGFSSYALRKYVWNSTGWTVQ